MKKLLLLLVVAALLATAASHGWETKPLEENIARLHLRKSLPELAPFLENEPLEIQAVLLDYLDDPVLLLKARAALIEHPDLARKILPLYGYEPEFRDVLRSHGGSALLPIAYFLDNKVRTLEFRHYAKRQADRFRGTDSDAIENTPTATHDQTTGQLTPEQRGWYAVNFILDEGHGFLGQFTLDDQGQIRWIQSQRFLGETGSLLLSGIRGLETKAQTGEKIEAIDIAWAAVDVFVVTSAFKVLRIGKVVTTGSRATAASRLARVGKSSIRTVKYGTALTTVAVVYVTVRHPSLINDALATVANLFGLPVLPTQLIGWTLILLPLLYLTSWLLRFLLPPVILLLRTFHLMISWLDVGKRKSRKSKPSSHYTHALKASSV